MKKVLILGGTGRLGTVLKGLLSPRYEIVTLARNERADIRADLNTFTDYQGFDIVVNCAAYKDVAKCEVNIEECLSANVTGVQHSLMAAAAGGVKRYLFISTDMAVDVYSVYGASKKIGDSLVVNFAKESEMECAVVRLGNIIGSRGSIFTVLAQKAKELGYVPVTDARMTRFFMPAARCAEFIVDLVVRDEELRGYIFAPCCPSYRILDVAAAVAPDSEVKLVGFRPGDTLTITMLSGGELGRTVRTEGGDYCVLPVWDSRVLSGCKIEGLVDLGGLEQLTSANNPLVASVEELRDLYKTL